jgi:hypothetical protein
MFLAASPAVVQSQDPQPNQVTVEADDDMSMPSMELLEFLGEWETEDGDWIDPVLLDEIPLPDREYSDE